eukprot:1325384-Amorphochlora_amoeboformis.AAC.1
MFNWLDLSAEPAVVASIKHGKPTPTGRNSISDEGGSLVSMCIYFLWHSWQSFDEWSDCQT